MRTTVVYCIIFFALSIATSAWSQSTPDLKGKDLQQAKVGVVYKVCLWKKGAKIKINGVPIYVDQTFSDPNQIKFEKVGDWINTFIVNSQNQAAIFSNESCKQSKSGCLAKQLKTASYEILKTKTPFELGGFAPVIQNQRN